MSALPATNAQWLSMLSPVLAKIQAEREAETAKMNRMHAEAVALCIETRAKYKASKNPGEAWRNGSIWTEAIASLLWVRKEIAEYGYILPQMPREAIDISAPV
jgi:hypothetical protein